MNATTERINHLKQSAATFWNERNKREQNMLAIGIAAVVLALIYMVLLDPAMSGRKDLQKKLPALRQQSAEVQSLAREVQATGQKSVAPPPALTRESVESSLTSKGLKPQNLAVTGELVKAQLNGASFSAITDWLTDVHRTMRLTVLDANIEAQQQVDVVNANLTLRQQRSDAQ
jgi:general secretion pathway protein M